MDLGVGETWAPTCPQNVALRAVQQILLPGCPPGSAEGQTHLQTSLEREQGQSFRAASRQVEDQLLHEPRMLHQPGPVQTSRLPHSRDDSVAAEVDRALRDLQASPADAQRPSAPAPDSDSAHLPSPVPGLPSLASSSSPVLSRRGVGDHDGSKAFAALRSALQVRESRLLQPQHAALSAAHSQAGRRTPDPAHQLPDVQPQSQLLRDAPEPEPLSLSELQIPREPVQPAQALDGSITPSTLTSCQAAETRAEDAIVPMASASVRQVTCSIPAHVSCFMLQINALNLRTASYHRKASQIASTASENRSVRRWLRGMSSSSGSTSPLVRRMLYILWPGPLS